MFVLALVEDTFRVDPHQFHHELKTLQKLINARYADRVLPGTGLCVTLHSIVSIGDAMIYPGEGAAYYQVTFKMVVFKPFRGEVLTGKIRSFSEYGITLSMGFFEDVTILAADLPRGSEFQQGVWVWRYTGETEDQSAELWMDVGEPFRFRVLEVNFNPPPRQKKFKKKPNPHAPPEEKKEIDGDEGEEQQYPLMAIRGTANEDGLGQVKWWS